MDKFLVLYKAPNAVTDEWMKKPEQERKPDETKMMDGWNKWMSANASEFADKGRWRRKAESRVFIGREGCTQRHHDVSIAQANSAEEAVKMFVDHPHFDIPQATIEVMPLKAMEG